MHKHVLQDLKLPVFRVSVHFLILPAGHMRHMNVMAK